MDISIVIRCAEDYRVFRCIESIDENADIIVSTSANPEFEKELMKRGIKYCLSPRKNLSKTSNIGFKHAVYDKVIITDSDTIFKSGCIQKMFVALDDYKMVKVRLSFQKSSKIPFSNIVAKSRDYVNSKELAFTPGLAVRKDIVCDIGGFLFNEDVPFAVDADLDYRVKKRNVPVCFLKKAVILHDAESVKHDLKAARRIGKGVAVSSLSLSEKFDTNSVKNIQKHLKAVKITDYPDILRKKGILVLFYQILWDVEFYIGLFEGKFCGAFCHE
ncbi:MAG: glycosyltransferase [Methanosarcinales archaeon]|jgi:choline kinase|nr:glycosyltransferase [Methanosarcinales archaeon]